MSKYIDTDVALQIWKEKDFLKLYSQVAKVEWMLALVPAAEVVPIGEEYECGYTDGQMAERKAIVRCKNCKNAETVNCPMYRAHFGYTDDDYCSCGELKEQKDGKDTDSDSDM